MIYVIVHILDIPTEPYLIKTYNHQSSVIEAFNYYLFNIDNPDFKQIVCQIYHIELEYDQEYYNHMLQINQRHCKEGHRTHKDTRHHEDK